MAVEGSERNMMEIIYSERYLDIFIDHDVEEPIIAPATLPWRGEHLNANDDDDDDDDDDEVGEREDGLEDEVYSEENENYEIGSLDSSSIEKSGSSDKEGREGGNVRRNFFGSTSEVEEDNVGSQGKYLRRHKTGAPSSPYPKRRKSPSMRRRENPNRNEEEDLFDEDTEREEDNIEEEEEEEDMFGVGDLNVDCGEEVEEEEYYFSLDPKICKRRKNFYDPKVPIPNIALGVCFRDHIQFKEAMTKYSVKGGYHLKHTKNEPLRQRYKCLGSNCEWMVFGGAAEDEDGDFWWIKTIGPEHTCLGTTAFVGVD